MGGHARERVTVTATSVWFPRAREVELREETLRGPGPGEIRVRATASGLSHGTEMLVFRGQVPADLALDLPTLAGSYAFPIKFGYASVGRVVELGAGVALAPGDLVFVHHPHQQEYVVSARCAAVPRKPSGRRRRSSGSRRAPMAAAQMWSSRRAATRARSSWRSTRPPFRPLSSCARGTAASR